MKMPKSHGLLECIPYEKCPAKTYNRPDGKVQLGRSVFNHCQIVGEVAQEIISRYPDFLRGSLFPKGAPLAAASHDIGKISPCFFRENPPGMHAR